MENLDNIVSINLSSVNESALLVRGTDVTYLFEFDSKEEVQAGLAQIAQAYASQESVLEL
jgi:hypothetical protein